MSHSKGYTVLSIAEQSIRKHEGVRKFPYRCTAGKLTIGVGRNLEDRGLLPDEIELLLANDIADCVTDLAEYTFWAGLSAIRKAALIDLAFCVGSGAGFRAFKKMRAALEAKDYPLAAQELRGSKFALQTGSRAEDLARMLTDDAI